MITCAAAASAHVCFVVRVHLVEIQGCPNCPPKTLQYEGDDVHAMLFSQRFGILDIPAIEHTATTRQGEVNVEARRKRLCDGATGIGSP